MAFDAQFFARLATWFVVFLLSLTCHEAAHALVGKLGGDETSKAQVTLDPIPHITREPFGTLLVPILSFFLYKGGWMIGWASAPYDPWWAERYPKRAALMAAAGPAANFVLVLIAGVAIRVGLSAGLFELPERFGFDALVSGAEGWAYGTALFLSVLFSINLVLGLFNLIPVPPLDGHAIVPLFMNDSMRHKWFAFFQGSGSILGLVVAWIVFGRIFAPIFGVALDLLYTGA